MSLHVYLVNSGVYPLICLCTCESIDLLVGVRLHLCFIFAGADELVPLSSQLEDLFQKHLTQKTILDYFCLFRRHPLATSIGE